MTVSSSHRIKEEGLNNLTDILAKGKINFYFVTLLENVRSFKKAKLGDIWDCRINQKVVGIKLRKQQGISVGR